MRRVFVRGVGAVTPLGADVRTSMLALARGQSAIGPVTRFDVTGYPCGVAAVVRDHDASPDADRRVSMSLRAVGEAIGGAGDVITRDAMVGVFIGAESGRASFATLTTLVQGAMRDGRFAADRFDDVATPMLTGLDAAALSPSTVASAIAGRLGARGPVRTISLACASGAAAIVEGVRAIRSGQCTVAVCGGVGADVDPMMLAGFGLLGALSAKGRSCPFDVRRDGFVVGEGAAMVVLSAERGDASVEIVGVGRTMDAHHLTAPDPTGRGAERAMRLALAEAGLVAVDHVQAHGTSTPLNDSVEAAALHRVLGAHVRDASVSSVKGALGHWIAGAGAIGLLAAHHAVCESCVLPTAGLEAPDHESPLTHVIGRAHERDVRTALVNAFAFGGANATLVLSRCRA